MPFKITRTDETFIPEKGADWFQEFLHSFATNKTGGYQDILDIINNRSHKDIESVVKSYREQCGLDALSSNTDDEELISEASVVGPISPMKLKKVESLEDISKDHKPEDLIVQIKFDGFKTQSIKTNGKIELYTRRGEKFTENVPDLVEQLNKVMSNDSFILGELTWEDKDGKQSISDIQTVVGSNPEKAHAKIKEGGGKVIFWVYDILWNKGKDITGQKYSERYNILKSIIGKQPNIKIADNYTWAEKEKAQKDAVAKNCEGLVIKTKDAEYKYATLGQNEPSGDMYKFKKGVKAKEADVILNKYHKDTEKLIFPAYQYDKKGELFEAGQLSGMSKEDESKLQKDIDSGKSVVVEVSYQERMESGKLRHMGWTRFRPDKSVKEVKMANYRPISIRQAAEQKSLVTVITNDPELKSIVESFARGSGGTKSTTAIIQYLREKLGNELVKFSDQDLIKYIDEVKKNSKQPFNEQPLDVGRVGTEKNEHRDDDVADYITHSTEK